MPFFKVQSTLTKRKSIGRNKLRGLPGSLSRHFSGKSLSFSEGLDCLVNLGSASAVCLGKVSPTSSDMSGRSAEAAWSVPSSPTSSTEVDRLFDSHVSYKTSENSLNDLTSSLARDLTLGYSTIASATPAQTGS